ncbi:type II toxin-antitoxin system RelE/ParE family toxin [Lachnospiraceae bacterium ZAX-1]
MQYKLIITERAEELLDNITKYMVNKLKNPQATDHLLAEIEHVYDNLECNPKMYAYLEDLFMKSRGYRKAVVPHYDYVIIFRIDEEINTIYIMGYFHDLELYRNKL